MRHVPVYQVIAEDLQAMGVDSVFGLMSDDICQLVATLDAIGVRFIGARHETQAVMMAAGYAAASGHLGVALVGRGMPGIAHSSAARAGVVELSRTLAFEWGPKVRVNCVAPGAFRTDGWEATYDEGVGNDMSGVPLPYPGRPSDVANATVFLASPAAAYITGECLYVDGGMILQGPISALPAGGYPERA